jgi:hypothetical protein
MVNVRTQNPKVWISYHYGHPLISTRTSRLVRASNADQVEGFKLGIQHFSSLNPFRFFHHPHMITPVRPMFWGYTQVVNAQA